MDPEKLKAIKNQVPGNTTCADCDTPSKSKQIVFVPVLFAQIDIFFSDPDWASINLGILFCIECSGIHRQLGSHISRVRSLELDDWPAGHVAAMTSLGNRLTNSILEANLGTNQKPGPQSSHQEKESFILAKYQRKEFISPLPENASAGSFLFDAILR